MRNIITLLLIAISVCANADWIYDTENKTLTSEEFFNADGVSQGRWIFKDVTCDAYNKLTITQSTSHSGPSSPQTLDFSLPITDAAGNKYSIIRFSGGSNKNLFGMDYNKASPVANQVERLIFPESIASFSNGFLGEFRNCKYYEFKGNYSQISSRNFSNSLALKEMKFHFLPPAAQSWSYTFINVPSWKSRILYPSFLSTAWTNVVYQHTGSGSLTAEYNSRLTDTHIENYNNMFSDVPPTGIARLNYFSGWKYQGFLVPYDEPTYENKIRIGIMGEPWDLFWAIKDTDNLKDETLTPKRYGYGVHEFDISNGDSVTIRAPKRYMTYNDTKKICLGYKLHSNPDVIVPWQETYTFDTAGNYGITWVWADHIPGFRISIR